MDNVTFLATLFLGILIGMLVNSFVDIVDYFTNKISKKKESKK